MPKNLEDETMFAPLIEHLRPVNFKCSKCPSSSGVEGGVTGGKSSLKHIRGDMRVNEIIICEAEMAERVALRLKSEEEVQ